MTTGGCFARKGRFPMPQPEGQYCECGERLLAWIGDVLVCPSCDHIDATACHAPPDGEEEERESEADEN